MTEINKIDKFLLQFDSKGKTYKSALNNFFKVIGKNPNTYFDDIETYDYESDVLQFMLHIKDLAPKSKHLYRQAIKSFLDFYKVELPNKFWVSVRRRIKGKKAVTRFAIPTNQQLKQILTNANAKYKALFLLVSSSGMRIGEALQLKINDVKLDTNTIYIQAKYTKTGERRITFFTPETKDAIELWMKQRDDDLKQMIKRTKKLGVNKSVDDRLFPIVHSSANHSWKRLLKKVGLDEKDETTGFTRMNIHELRKYFRTRLGSVINTDVIEAIIGHEEGLTAVYRRFTEEDLREEYEKGRHKLYVFETEVADERLKDMEDEVDLLKEKVELLARYRGVFEGEFDMDGEETLEELISIDKGLAEVRKKEKASAKNDDAYKNLLNDEKEIKSLRKRIKEDKEKTTVKTDDIIKDLLNDDEVIELIRKKLKEK